MSPDTLSYDELRQEISQEIQKHNHGVLATSQGDFVTAREMAIITDGEKIWCFTASHTRKYKQMEANKNVALSINNLQIEGTAILKGDPSDEENKEFLKMFEEKFPKSWEFWRGQLENPDSAWRLIEITPKKHSVFKRTYTDILNVEKETATRAYLNDTDYDQL